MLPGEKNPRQVLRRLGDRRQLIDPADDLIAKRQGLRQGAFCIRLVHDFPMTKPAAVRNTSRPDDTSSVPAQPRWSLDPCIDW
jgi:hypothetical protein